MKKYAWQILAAALALIVIMLGDRLSDVAIERDHLAEQLVWVCLEAPSLWMCDDPSVQAARRRTEIATKKQARNR